MLRARPNVRIIGVMHESWITSSTQDELNARIWTQSPNLQRAISATASHQEIGAQQAMPKPEHSEKFSATNPLPWVPDLVGPEFGKAKPSVLIVGSSYNGFLDGYSGRAGRMRLDDYLAARDAKTVHDGLKKFVTSFIKDVCENDKAYYARIRRLLSEAEIPLAQVCITDLAKVSFVQKQGTGKDRLDQGGDGVVSKHLDQWQHYVLGSASEDLGTMPIPYQWLGQRVGQAQIILALGKLAEYGVIKVLKRQSPKLKIVTHKHPAVPPDQASLDPGMDWCYDYAHTKKGVNSWLDKSDWWNLDDPSNGEFRQLLACVHPSSWKRQEPNGHWLDNEEYYATGYGRLLNTMERARLSSSPQR